MSPHSQSIRIWRSRRREAKNRGWRELASCKTLACTKEERQASCKRSPWHLSALHALI
jgi:hypothetical protein